MQLTVRARTTAAPDGVYAVLADVASHLKWAGENQLPMFGLVEIAGASLAGAGVGDTWSSTGRIPLHRYRWEDRSEVTTAEPSRCFEYVTESRIVRSRSRSDRQATYRHRYEIEPHASGGSSVAYTISEERFEHPLLRVGLPGVRAFTWATGVRLMVRRGLRNLTTLASERQVHAPLS